MKQAHMLAIRSKKGFTLIELLVVMVILGILATIVGGNFIGSKEKARDAKRKNDLKQLSVALEAYYNDKGAYPTGYQGKIRVRDAANTYYTLEWGDQLAVDSIIYMAELPIDPSPNANQYTYLTNAAGTQYQIFSTLENEHDADYTTSFPSASTCHFGVSSTGTLLTDAISSTPGTCVSSSLGGTGKEEGP